MPRPANPEVPGWTMTVSSPMPTAACIMSANCTECQGLGDRTMEGHQVCPHSHRALVGRPLGSGRFLATQSPRHPVPTVDQATRKVGDLGAFFFLFGIKRPEVERNMPWMCPPRRPPQSDPTRDTGDGPLSPQARLPTEVYFAQSCQKGTETPSTPVTRNDCAANTVAPKGGRQKLPEGKAEIPHPLQIRLHPPPGRMGRGCRQP